MGCAFGEQKEEQSAEKVAPGIGQAQGARNLAVKQGGERADGVENSRRAEGPNIEQRFGQEQGSQRAPGGHGGRKRASEFWVLEAGWLCWLCVKG